MEVTPLPQLWRAKEVGRRRCRQKKMNKKGEYRRCEVGRGGETAKSDMGGLCRSQKGKCVQPAPSYGPLKKGKKKKYEKAEAVPQHGGDKGGKKERRS